jgi:hypothetical protein
MDRPKRRRHTSALAAVVILLPLAAYVVYSSLQVSTYECDVCMAFGGGEICRTVTGETEEEGIRTGIDNACALLASGMTEVIKCGRTQPVKAVCRSLGAGG